LFDWWSGVLHVFCTCSARVLVTIIQCDEYRGETKIGNTLF
jgi:hypothetical protein